MPISADQWRTVTGVNNVQRPRQVGIKPRYMQQEIYGDSEKLSHHPEPDANQDIARGGTGLGSKTEPQIKNSSSRGRNDQSGPMRDKVKDDSRSTWVDGDHDNFTSAMPSSVTDVQILQSFISVVVILLLLLSGDVETNPGPAILSVDKHLRHVKRAVWEARTQWKNIGRSLPGLSEGTIQSIHEANDGECLHQVLLRWMKTGRATINDLLEALEDPTVDHRDIANNIRALKGKDRINIGLEPDTDNSQPQGKKRKQQSGTSGPQGKKQKITPAGKKRQQQSDTSGPQEKKQKIKSTGGIGTSISPGSTGPMPSSSHSAVQSQQSGTNEESMVVAQRLIQTVNSVLTEIGDEDDMLLVGEAKLTPHDLLQKLNKSSAGVDPENAVKIGVIGVTSSGKSATLNALMGDRYLPSGTDPETACTVCIHHQADPTPELFEFEKPTDNKHEPLKTDACTVCVNQQADPPAELFEFEKPTDNKHEQLQKKVEAIRTSIKNANVGQRGSPKDEVVADLKRLHLYAPVKSIGETETKVELYDIPGTSEAEMPNLDRVATQARGDLAGMILVLGADSLYFKSTDELLKAIKYKQDDKCDHNIMSLQKKEVRLIVILNKCDHYYDDQEEDTIEEKKRKVADFLRVPSTDIVTFFSASWALKAMQVKRSSLSEDEYRGTFYSIPEKARLEKQELKEYSAENVGNFLEELSGIGKLEKKITDLCKNHIEVRVAKAIEDCYHIIKDVEKAISQKVKGANAQILRYETIKRHLVTNLPDAIHHDFVAQQTIIVNTFQSQLEANISREIFGIAVGGQCDSHSVLEQRILAVRDSSLSLAKTEVVTFWTQAIEVARVRLTVQLEQMLGGLAKELFAKGLSEVIDFEKFKLNKFVSSAIEEIQQPVVDGNESIENDNVKNFISELTITKLRSVDRKTHGERRYLVAGPRRTIRYKEAEEYQVTVYEPNITGLNSAFNSFSLSCAKTLRDCITQQLNELTEKLSNEAVKSMLELSGQPDWEDWLRDGEGQKQKCKERIRVWEERRDRLEKAAELLSPDLPGVEVVGRTCVMVTNSEQSFHWTGYGFKLHIPQDSLPAGVGRCLLHISASIAGQYQFPDNMELQPLTAELQHCANTTSSTKLTFVRALCSQEHLPYTFKEVDRRDSFAVQSSYGSLQLNHFSGIALAGRNIERLYTASLYYLPGNPRNTEIHLVITWDDEVHLKAVNLHYQEKRAREGSYLRIEFEQEKISLDIPMKGGVAVDEWKIWPLIPPILSKSTVDSFKPGQRIPSLQLRVKPVRQGIEKISELSYLVNLQGAREPNTVMRIEIEPVNEVVSTMEAQSTAQHVSPYPAITPSSVSGALVQWQRSAVHSTLTGVSQGTPTLPLPLPGVDNHETTLSLQVGRLGGSSLASLTPPYPGLLPHQHTGYYPTTFGSTAYPSPYHRMQGSYQTGGLGNNLISLGGAGPSTMLSSDTPKTSFTFKNVERELKAVLRWHRLGTNLGIPQDILKAIKLDNTDVDSQNLAFFNLIVRNYHFSWEDICTALEGMEESVLATQIRSKYCNEDTSDSESTSEDQSISGSASVGDKRKQEQSTTTIDEEQVPTKRSKSEQSSEEQ